MSNRVREGDELGGSEDAIAGRAWLRQRDSLGDIGGHDPVVHCEVQNEREDSMCPPHRVCALGQRGHEPLNVGACQPTHRVRAESGRDVAPGRPIVLSGRGTAVWQLLALEAGPHGIEGHQASPRIDPGSGPHRLTLLREERLGGSLGVEDLGVFTTGRVVPACAPADPAGLRCASFDSHGHEALTVPVPDSTRQ